MTLFVHQALLHRAVEHATDMALNRLMNSHPGDPKWKSGIAALRSAYEDAGSYIDTAPPDQRQMRGIMNVRVLLECVVQGPEVDENLDVLKVRSLLTT